MRTGLTSGLIRVKPPRVASMLLAPLALLTCHVAGAQTSAGQLSTEQLRATCDRTCLIAVMNRYLAAMSAHDPAQADFGTHVKFTENGVTLPIGSGLWVTMDGLGKFRQFIADPQDDSVAFLGTITERGQPEILSVRLKLNDQVIDEAEQIVVRHDPKGAQAWNERVGPGSPMHYTSAGWNDTLTSSERVSRARMIAIANSYFSAIQGGAATPVPFAPGCYRIENGLVTSGAVPGPGSANRPPEFHDNAHCAEQLEVKGFFDFNTELRDRRYPVVDVDKGIVFSHVFFDHAGTVTSHVDLNGIRRPVTNPLVALPNTLAINEIFWIKNGVIQHIAANIIVVPFGMGSGWEK